MPSPGFTITGESYPVPFSGQAVFDLTGGGAEVRRAFAVTIFTDAPTDSPATCTLTLDSRNAFLTDADSADGMLVTVDVSIAPGTSTAPCTEGQDVGSFTISQTGRLLSVTEGELSFSSTELSHVMSGSFAICLTASSDKDGTLDIRELDVLFGSDAGPPPDAPDIDATEIEVSFPESGDAVMIVEEQVSATSATFYGSIDATTGEMTVTAFDLESDVGTTSVTLDDQERPTEVVMDTLRISAEYNPDGTANLELSEDGVVVSSASSINLEDDVVADALLESSGVATKARAPRALERYWRENEAQPKETAEDCIRKSFFTFTVKAIQGRGYDAYHRDQRQAEVELADPQAPVHRLPLFRCLEEDDGAQLVARRVCQVRVLAGATQQILVDACVEEGNDRLDCLLEAQKILTNLDLLFDFAVWAGEDIADRRWDDPECGCEVQSDCPDTFVCQDKQCVPKCTGPDDCPEGRKVCESDGRCVAEEGEDEDEDEGEDEVEEPEPVELDCPVPDGAQRSTSVAPDGSSSDFYWLDGVGYVGPYLLWWDAAMTQPREQVCYDSESNKHGWWLTWFQNGRPNLEAQYERGQRHGLYREWHEGGDHAKTEAQYLNNELDGLKRTWFADGERETEVEYSAGLKNGDYRKFYSNGNPEFETQFVNNVENGTRTEFDESGTPTTRCVVEDGAYISCEQL